MSTNIPNRTKVFISYSHEDSEWLRQLQTHLKPLEREGIIDLWDDTRIIPGQKWNKEIQDALDATRVAVLIVSAHFLASDFIAENELSPLLEAAKQGGAVVLPVIVSPCRYTHTADLGKFQAVNDPSKTLVDLSEGDRNRVWVELTELIEEYLKTPIEQKDRPAQPARPSFYALDYDWVGREQIVANLSNKIRDDCRFLLILGLTGIGKTALAERIAVEVQDWFDNDWQKGFKRVNFDYEEKAVDFGSVALNWLEEWGEDIPPVDRQPEQLLNRLLAYMKANRTLILIDSLERLLDGKDEQNLGEFQDLWWKKFFLLLLSAESCQTRIIVTSQDLPTQVENSRYRNFWYHQVLYGLDETEQQILFETAGFDVEDGSQDRSILLRLGNAYKGHPLVLRVIIGEIEGEPFYGNVQAYWGEVRDKIEEVEKALEETEKDAQNTLGAKDDWHLHKLTRTVYEHVNRQRLEVAFNRLKAQVMDAYILICRSSVYRAPVQIEGWLKQLASFIRRREGKDCGEERKEIALDELRRRFLIEETFNHNNKQSHWGQF